MDVESLLRELAWPVALLATLLGSILAVAWLTNTTYTLRDRLRDRFIGGVPWGSILVCSGVLLVYLVVQDGLANWSDPVYLPFVNWSYLYPTGVLLSGFTHAGAGHLTSNLLTAAVLAPLAEYIWGHYPSTDRRFRPAPPWERPRIRAFVIFPGIVLVAGLLSSLFAWGPVIGFSGVVFAFAGFTAVRYPLLTILLLVGRSAIREFARAFTDPISVDQVGTTVTTPWYAGVSVEGHALGFLMGAISAILLIHHRDQSAYIDPRRLWIGLLLLGMLLSLWPFWTSTGSETYVLYRAFGIVLMLVSLLAITVAAVSQPRPVWRFITRRQLAILLVLLPLLVLALVAIPLNLLTVVNYDQPETALEVGDYDVYYDHNTERHFDSLLLPSNETSTTSGVIVVSEDRHFWTRAVSATDLERAGSADIPLGGLLWREDVTIERSGWDPVGNDSTYLVEGSTDGNVESLYAAEQTTAEPVIAGHTIAIDATLERFYLDVSTDSTTYEREPVPDTNESATFGDLTIQHENDELVAQLNGTDVRIATWESP